MGKSRRKNPIFGIAVCDSEKKDKQAANRKLRRKIKEAVARGEEVMPEIREVSDVWNMGKDGKQYCPEFEKGLRK